MKQPGPRCVVRRGQNHGLVIVDFTTDEVLVRLEPVHGWKIVGESEDFKKIVHKATAVEGVAATFEGVDDACEWVQRVALHLARQPKGGTG